MDLSYLNYKDVILHIKMYGGRLIESEGKISYMARNDFGQYLLKNKKTLRTVRRRGLAQKVRVKLTWTEGLHFVNESTHSEGE